MIGLFARIFEIEGRQLLARVSPHDEREGIMLVWSMWADDAGCMELKLSGGDLEDLTPHVVISRLTERSARHAYDQLVPFIPCFKTAAEVSSG